MGFQLRLIMKVTFFIGLSLAAGSGLSQARAGTEMSAPPTIPWLFAQAVPSVSSKSNHPKAGAGGERRPQGKPKDSPVQSRAEAPLTETPLSKLPKLDSRQRSSPQWVEIVGLNAQALRTASAVSGQPTLQLTSLASSENRRIGVRFTGAAKGKVDRVAAWVKPGTETWVSLTAVDDPLAVAALVTYDLALPKVDRQFEQVVNRGIEEGRDGWLKVWIDFKPENSDVIVQLALYGLNPPASLTLGGMTLEQLK